MALTKEQFSTLRARGLTTDQIIRFESGQYPTKDPAPQTDILGTAIKTATDPFLRNFGMDSQSKQAQDLYSRGRESLLDSEAAKKMRSNFSNEPFASIPKISGLTKGPIPVSQNEVVKQLQGLGIDTVALGIGDAAVARGPATLARSVIDPVSKGSESLASRFLNFYIKPRQTGYMFGKNPGRGVSKHIGPTLTRDSLLEKIRSKNSELLSQLKDAMVASGNPVDIAPVAQAFKRNVIEMEKFPETFKGPLEAHKAFARDLDKIVQKGGNITPEGKVYLRPEDALDIKRAIGKIPSWSVVDPRLGSITKTSREAYGALDKSIDEAVPGSAGINQDISDLIGAEKGIELGQQREQNKMPIGGLEILGALLAGGGNLLTPQALAVGGAIKASRSAPFNTTAGYALSRAGRAGRSVSEVLKKTERPSLVENLLEKLLGRNKTNALSRIR